MKDLKHASARGVAWNLVQNVISRTLALVVVAILSRILDRSAFGGVALALAITSFFELLANQGYGEFITQTPDLKDEHLDTAFWFNVVIGALFAGVIAIGADPLARMFDEPSAAPVIQWLSLSLVIRALSIVPAGLLVRQLRFRSLSMRSVAAASIGGAAGIVAAFSGLGVYSLVIQLLVGDLAGTIILWGATEWRPGRQFSRTALKQLSAFGTPIIGAMLLGFVTRRLDTLIVGSVLGLAMLGVYSIAQRVFQIALQVINKSTTDVAFSALSRLGESDERRRAFLNVIELTAVLCFPMYVGLAVVAKPLTLTLFGARWADSAPVLVMFALSGVPFSLSLVHLAAIKSAAKTRFLFFINLILLIVYLPFMVLLVGDGPAPAAAASLISCGVILPVEILFMRAALSFRLLDYLKSLGGASLATLVMAGASVAMMTATSSLSSPLQLIVASVAGAAIYVIALRLIAPATFKRCREVARSMTRKAPSQG